MKLTTEKLKKLILSEMKSYDVVSETEVDGFPEKDYEEAMSYTPEVNLQTGLEDLKKNPKILNRYDVVQAINTVIDFLKQPDMQNGKKITN